VRERKFVISNAFASVNEDYTLPNVYTEEDSSIMTMECVANGKDMFGCFAHGEVVRVEFEPRNAHVRPSAVQHKYETYHTVLSFGVAVLQAMRCIMQMTRVTNFNELDIEWNVVALLPPQEVVAGAKELTDLLNSAKIRFKQPEVDLSNIKLNRVSILPEGFCAYVGAVYERPGAVRVGYEEISRGITLVLDVGAGTTDMLFIENNHVVEGSKHTVQIGGNNVMQIVRAKINNEYGFKPTENDTNRAIECGILKDGAKSINILDIIDSAKHEVAGRIVSDIRDYVEEIAYNMRRVENLLLCGGGTLSGTINEAVFTQMGYDASEIHTRPFSEDLQEYLLDLAPNIALVPNPVGTIKTEEGEEIKEEISPRLLNITGASIIANKFV
jgi:hypothetical protein